MNRRTAMFVAIVLAVVAVVMLQNYISEIRSSYSKESTTLVVARSNLEEGTVITPKVLTTQEGWPLEYKPSNAFTKDNIDMAYGHQLLVPVKKGDPILSTHLTRPQPIKPLRELLKEGERAITLACDETSGVGGMILPNDHVDIIGTFTVSVEELAKEGEAPGPSGFGLGERSFTYTLLQDVTVLAVDDRRAFNDSAGGEQVEKRYSTITVALTPREARMVTFAFEKGRLSFALRPMDDAIIEDEEEQLEVVDVKNLFQHLIRETKTRKTRRIKEIRPGG